MKNSPAVTAHLFMSRASKNEQGIVNYIATMPAKLVDLGRNSTGAVSS